MHSEGKSNMPVVGKKSGITYAKETAWQRTRRRARLAVKSTKRYFRMRAKEKQNTIPFNEIPKSLSCHIERLKKSVALADYAFAAATGGIIIGFINASPPMLIVGGIGLAGLKKVMAEQKKTFESIHAEVERLKNYYPFTKLANYKYYFLDPVGNITPTNRRPTLKTRWLKMDLGYKRMQLQKVK